MIRSALLGMVAALAITAPAAAQDFAIVNATVATGDGSEPIADGTVVVRNGQIDFAGPSSAVGSLDVATVIDAQGRWVTPGIFATVTDLGLWDIGAVSESNDVRAGDSPFSAALDAAPAINPASQHVMIARDHGITRAAAASLPSAAIFGGQGAVIDTGADPQPIVKARAFQSVVLGETGARIAGGSRTATYVELANAFREAQEFAAGRWDGEEAMLTRADAEALGPVVSGRQKLLVYVERASDIRSALALRGDFPRLDMVLVGASEGWMVASDIAAAGVPVIADGLDDLPERFEELAATQSNIGRMKDAGVDVAINAYAMEAPRNLPQYAGNLVALQKVNGATGLSWGEAFAAITSVPARISGYDGVYGVLRPRAAGDVVIWDGDPLELSSAPVQVFIDGIKQPQDTHQTRLRERYRDLDESDLPKAYDW